MVNWFRNLPALWTPLVIGVLAFISIILLSDNQSSFPLYFSLPLGIFSALLICLREFLVHRKKQAESYKITFTPFAGFILITFLTNFFHTDYWKQIFLSILSTYLLTLAVALKIYEYKTKHPGLKWAELQDQTQKRSNTGKILGFIFIGLLLAIPIFILRENYFPW